MEKFLFKYVSNPWARRVSYALILIPIIALVVIVFCDAVRAAEPEQAGIGTFSEGYRIGQITKFSVKGLIWKSGEGEMLVGNESTPLIETYSCDDGKTCTRQVNPWAFSTGPAYANFIDGYIGEYAVIRYRQAHVKSLKRNTDYEVMEAMAPLDSSALAQDSCVAPDFVQGSKSAGTRVGRLVKISWKGTFTKTYEVTMQVGNSGNQFHHMSISEGEDKGEYVNCLLQMLMAGAKVKVNYSESFIRNPLARDTAYDIVSVKLASKGLGD